MRQKNAEEKDAALKDLRYNLALSQILLSQAAFNSGNVAQARELLNQVPPDLRRWEWRYLKRLYAGGIFTINAHKGFVHSVAFSPDGSLLATGGADKMARIWDSRNGAPLLELKGHKGAVSSVAFTPDGKRLLTGSDDGTARFWDAQHGGLLFELEGHQGKVNTVAISPDGASAATAGDGSTVEVWNTAAGTLQLALKLKVNAPVANLTVTSVAFSRDGIRLATVDTENTLTISDSRSGQPVLAVKLEGLTSKIPKGGPTLAFSPDGKQLVVRLPTLRARIRDADSSALLATMKGPALSWTMFRCDVCFSPDGRYLVCPGWDKTQLWLWDMREHKPALELKGHTAPAARLP